MKPIRSNRNGILGTAFEYVPACRTDISRTFARIRREQEKLAEQKPSKVIAQIGKRK